MGKQRRQRQQYHIQATKSKAPEEVVVNSAQVASTSMNISLENNPFANIAIDIGSMKKTLLEDDDVRSVKSFKSVKSEMGGSSVMKKKDKIKMRRELLMQKIGSVNQKMKEVEKRHAEKKKRQHDLMGDTNPLLEALDYVTTNECITAEEVLSKSRTIQKADKRKKDYTKGLTIYQRIMKNAQFLKNPMDAIKDHVTAVVEAEKNKIVKKK